ncbi:CBS domain-containing protein [Pseudoalteromonas luteoviolacea]|uniref:CBS domain-containing protein n=1 Tax=Pseudoalteromonas luteoviolacea TaxID=43657 RepID=UPI001B35EF46|nr:CBS domain-containing protein [Pseudoalteromonas luteoviolacea]MBQ4838925.1 CBS domain-containing protein [Pseudoalteromonas luteoviolacea]
MANQFIADIMSTQFPTITPDTEITEAIEQLQTFGLFGAPVQDFQGKLVGFISEQQLLAPLLQSSYFCDGANQVAQLMSTETLSVKKEMTVVDLAAQMQQNKPKIYPVVEEGKVIAIVTRSQVINVLKENYLSCSTH